MELDKMEAFLFQQNEYLKNVAVDNVIFGYHNKELKALLLKTHISDKWTVPGGYIKKTETIGEAAERIAFARTGLKGLYLQQFHSFGSPQRVLDKDFSAKQINERLNVNLPDDFWIFDYFVSLCFYTLTEFSAVIPKKGEFDVECEWWPVSDLPPMMFDHAFLVSEALKALRLHIAHYPIGFELLPEKFTVPEIHSLYETILGKTLDSRNFLRRLLATQIIEKLDETKSIGRHRSPFLYKFNKEIYKEGLSNGVELAF